MLDQSQYSAQEALDLIQADTPPLAFGKGTAVYRAAVKKLRQLDIPGMMTSDLAGIPMTLAFVDLLFERWDRTPPRTTKEKESRAQQKSRLRTIARRLEGTPIVHMSEDWAGLCELARKLAQQHGWSEQTLIPLTSSLRAEAVADRLEPTDLSRDWLANLLRVRGRKRRDSLKAAARLLDELWCWMSLRTDPAAIGNVTEN
ncbi:hypothetical protein [Salipiger marinus]|uniref:Uncharacterized protein n=1 Tax=Salipiger marinus TaxID=555512 RepID=A0A1G8VCX2_9RHOB|nr:hypothetical protein [Salipiger marinus]SDJ63717.1 hypothetical protein SAMN04487993_10882 [Salipiger marinus]